MRFTRASTNIPLRGHPAAPSDPRRGDKNFNYANQLQRLHPSFVLQHVATMTHHTPPHSRSPPRSDAGWHRTAVPPAALSGPTADGPGPGAAVQALCPPPARGGTRSTPAYRVPPCQPIGLAPFLTYRPPATG